MRFQRPPFFVLCFALLLVGWGVPLAAQDDLPFTKRQTSIQGIVVTETAAGMMGRAVDIILTVTPRDKKQTRFERSVGQDMVTSLNEAVRAVQVTHSQWDGTQVRVSFENKYSSKDGGSAGTAYAVCLRSLLEDFEIDPNYAMTGDITVDQRVRQIAGVSAKIKGATADGAKIIGIPTENVDALSDMMLLDSPQPLLDTQVFSLDTLDDAVELARTDRDPNLADAIAIFDELRETLGRRGYKGLRTAENQAILAEIVQIAPNHISADLLLKYSRGETPRRLSVTGSLMEVMDRGRPAFEIMDNTRPGKSTKEQRQVMRTVLAELRTLRSMTHPEVAKLRAAMASYAATGNKLITAKKPTNRQVERFNTALDNLVKTYNEISEDPKTIEAMMRDSY